MAVEDVRSLPTRKKRTSSNVPTTDDPLVGKVLGDFTVMIRTWRGRKGSYYQCRCGVCGEDHIFSYTDLAKGPPKTCDDHKYPAISKPKRRVRRSSSGPSKPRSKRGYWPGDPAPDYKNIPTMHKRIMRLRMIEGLGVAEVTRQLACSASHVNRTFARYRDLGDAYWRLCRDE